MNAALILFKLLLIAVDSHHILGRRQYAADDRLAQGHLVGHVPVKQLICHISLAVQVPHAGGRQAQQLRIRIHMQEPVHALSPHFRFAAMKLVQDHVVRTNFRHFLQLHGQELCIGEEVNILRLLSSGDSSQILHLCPENISAGRQPANRFVRMVRAELKGNKGFSGAGGMHDRSLSLILQHSACRVVCSLVVGK